MNLNKNKDEFTTPAKQLVGQKGAFHTKDTPRTKSAEDKKGHKALPHAKMLPEQKALPGLESAEDKRGQERTQRKTKI